jgi:hypothetical protein
MENVNSKNKVVEYEIITTKKFRQVVKVQFDEKYSDELDETKITPSEIDFELGEEMSDETTHTFSNKIVNEPLETGFRSPTTKNGLITFDGETKKKVSWGNFVPKETKSVLVYKSEYSYGKNNGDKIIYLNCSNDLVEQLWRSSNFKDLSSYIISYEYLDDEVGYEREKRKNEIHRSVIPLYVNQPLNIKNSDIGLHYDDDKVENGLDLLKTIYKKQNKKGVDIVVFEVQSYVGLGVHPHTGYYSNRFSLRYDEIRSNLIDLNNKK